MLEHEDWWHKCEHSSQEAVYTDGSIRVLVPIVTILNLNGRSVVAQHLDNDSGDLASLA
jgi:hypothetical protein